MKSLVLLALSLLASCNAFAAELATPDAAVALTNQIMERVAAGDMQGGMNLAKPYTTIRSEDLDDILSRYDTGMPIAAKRIGKSIGYEIVRNNSFGGSLAQVVYLQRFEKSAVVWQFVLYRGSNGWLLNSITFADDISAAF